VGLLYGRGRKDSALRKVSNVHLTMECVIKQGIVLNRAQVYASARRHLVLSWQARIFLRILPIAMFLYQIQTVLQTMRCQTSSYLPQVHSGDPEQARYTAYTGEGGFLYRLSSTMLFWQDDQTSCLSAGMIPHNGSFTGSSSILWPLFLTICFSHFIETVSSALQGRQSLPEFGMSIFEHSIAFAEAEAVVRGSLGLGLFGWLNPLRTSTPTASGEVPSNFSQVPSGLDAVMLSCLNLPSEVLLTCLISCFSHLSNHTLGVLGLQSRCRLVNTGTWGLSFLGAFLWSFVRLAHGASGPEVVMLRFPSVYIMG